MDSIHLSSSPSVVSHWRVEDMMVDSYGGIWSVHIFLLACHWLASDPVEHSLNSQFSRTGEHIEHARSRLCMQ